MNLKTMTAQEINKAISDYPKGSVSLAYSLADVFGKGCGVQLVENPNFRDLDQSTQDWIWTAVEHELED